MTNNYISALIIKIILFAIDLFLIVLFFAYSNSSDIISFLFLKKMFMCIIILSISKYISTFIHEFGHVYYAYKCKIKIPKIVIGPLIIFLNNKIKIKFRIKGIMIFGGCVLISINDLNSDSKYKQFYKSYLKIVLGGIKFSIYLFLLSSVILAIVYKNCFLRLIMISSLVFNLKILLLSISSSGAVKGDCLVYNNLKNNQDYLISLFHNNYLVDYVLNDYIKIKMDKYYERNSNEFIYDYQCLNYLTYNILYKIINGNQLTYNEISLVKLIFESEEHFNCSVFLGINYCKVTYSFLIYARQRKLGNYGDFLIKHNLFVDSFFKKFNELSKIKKNYIIHNNSVKNEFNINFIKIDIFNGLPNYELFLNSLNKAINEL